ncbi:MAG: DOPA 4,5-dioxygenase family protein [Burkholderiales bacterium]
MNSGVAIIASYHAHVYYEPATTREVAARLRERIGAQFRVQLGRWHDVPVGPHPGAMYQVAFEVAAFERLVPWLMLNRDGLTVLVHPNTGRPRDDHLVHALWLGGTRPLNGDTLPLSEPREEISPIVPNTAVGA